MANDQVSPSAEFAIGQLCCPNFLTSFLRFIGWGFFIYPISGGAGADDAKFENMQSDYTVLVMLV